MTKIITLSKTDYTRMPDLTDGDKLALEAEAMRNTQRRIDERKARLAAGIKEEIEAPAGMAAPFFLELVGGSMFIIGLCLFVGALCAYIQG